MEYELVNCYGGDLQSYINYVKGIEYLTIEEEKALANRVRTGQDAEAAKRLILSHLRLVVSIASKYNGYGLQLADLIQEGTIGLMKAIKKFDERREIRLVTFASYWIKAEIVQFVLNNWRLVKVATTAAQKKLFFKLRSYKDECGRLSYKDVKHISEELHVTTSDIREVNGYLSHSDSPIYCENDNEDIFENSIALADDSSNPALMIENRDLNIFEAEGLKEILEMLDKRKRYIIESRWLNPQRETLEEISHKFEISIERVRQLEQEALKQMRAAFIRKISANKDYDEI